MSEQTLSLPSSIKELTYYQQRELLITINNIQSEKYPDLLVQDWPIRPANNQIALDIFLQALHQTQTIFQSK